MNQLWPRIREAAGKLLRTGFFSVFFSNVACKVLVFIGGTIIVRVLSKSDYGTYSYVMNCMGMVSLLGDLGCSMATGQFCNENHADIKRRNTFFSYGLSRGIAFSAVVALLLYLSPWYYPFRTEEAATLTRNLCLMPFLNTTNNFLLTNLRVRLENHLFGVINLFQTLIHYVAILPMSYWIGLRGAVYSNYVIAFLVLVFSLWASRKHLDFSWRWSTPLSHPEQKSFLKLAFASQLNSGMAQGLILLDVFLIGLIIGDDTVIASYKVASTVPAALAFIPASIIAYIGPYFARNNQDLNWVRQSYIKLLAVCAGGSLLISGAAILTASWTIPLVFGKQYTDAVPCFIVLMIGYFFHAGIQTPSQNIIYTQRKVRVNLIITFLSGGANCVLDTLWILNAGSIGAAWATTAVHMFSAALCFGYMCYYLRRRTPA